MGKGKFNKASQVLACNINKRAANDPSLTKDKRNQYMCDVYKFCDYLSEEVGTERISPESYKDFIQRYLNNCIWGGESPTILKEYAISLAYATKCTVDDFEIIPGAKF